MKRFVLTVLASFIVISHVSGQTAGNATFDWQNHYDKLYEQAEMKYHFATAQPRKVTKWQKEFRSALKDAIGLSIIEKSLKDYKPTADFISSEELDYCIRERWVIWTEPDVPVTCVILRPKNVQGKVPLVITPHGHNKNTELYAGVCLDENDRHLIEDGERDVAVQAVKEGYIAIAPATRGFGITRHPREINSNAGHSCRTQLMNGMLVGRMPAGERVWDIMKLIDYALENLPVDGKNIIVSGQSGGGTTTVYSGAIDTRISIAAPCCAFCSFAGSIGCIMHCECNYVPGILNLGEMGDIAGLTAPRAFYSINGIKDDIFPIDEVRKAFNDTKQIYKAFGAEDKCQLYEGAHGHRFYKDGIWDFVRKNLK